MINNCLLMCHNNSRFTYTNDKKLAEVGDMIEKGEEVSAKKALDLDHSLWLMTKGTGFGQVQWR